MSVIALEPLEARRLLAATVGLPQSVAAPVAARPVLAIRQSPGPALNAVPRGPGAITLDAAGHLSVLGGVDADVVHVRLVEQQIIATLLTDGMLVQESFFNADAVLSVTIDTAAAADVVRVTDLPGELPINVQSGDGSDRLLIDDTNADVATAHAWTFGLGQVRRNVAWLTHSGVETVEAMLGAGQDNVAINAVALGTKLTVSTGPGDDSVSVGPDVGKDMLGFTTVVGGEGNDTLVVTDDVSPLFSESITLTATEYFVGNTAVTLAHSTFEDITLNGPNNATIFRVEAVLLGTSVTVNGRGFDDTLNLGRLPAGLNAVRGPVTYHGGGGRDIASLNDGLAGVAKNYLVTPTAITTPGQPFGGLTYDGVLFVDLFAGEGADTIEVTAVDAAVDVDIFAGRGNDTMIVSSVSAVIGSLDLQGQDGVDSLELRDSMSGAGYTLQTAQLNRAGMLPITFAVDSAGSLQLQTGTLSMVNVAASSAPVRLLPGDGTAVSVMAAASADVLIEAAGTLQSISIGATSVARLLPAVTPLVTGGLSIASGGRLNLAGRPLIIDYTGASPLVPVTASIAAARSSSWAGAGLTSAPLVMLPDQSLGVAEAADVLGPTGGTFLGVAVDATAILIRQTLLGDANLDAAVNVADLGRLAATFRAAGGWANGDFNYDGIVDVSDLGLLAAHFRQSL